MYTTLTILCAIALLLLLPPMRGARAQRLFSVPRMGQMRLSELATLGSGLACSLQLSLWLVLSPIAVITAASVALIAVVMAVTFHAVEYRDSGFLTVAGYLAVAGASFIDSLGSLAAGYNADAFFLGVANSVAAALVWKRHFFMSTETHGRSAQHSA